MVGYAGNVTATDAGSMQFRGISLSRIRATQHVNRPDEVLNSRTGDNDMGAGTAITPSRSMG